MKVGNIFERLPPESGQEQFNCLLETAGSRLERIVSRGHATPAGEWYDQDRPEWVVLLTGAAGLLIEGETEIRVFRPGDYIFIPAHLRHRVEWTQSGVETVWLALHYKE